MGGRFARGAAYMGAANWTSYALNFAIGILVARILGPEAFGEYAFVVAINEFVNIVNGLAIAPALVQSRTESDRLYDTGYAVSFAQALVGLLISLAIAAVLAHERSMQSAWFLLLLAGARFPILLADVVLAGLDRNVHYGAIAWINLTTRSLPNLACLWLAWLGWGPLTLVLRDVATGVLPWLLAHWWSGYRYRGRLGRSELRALMSYSGPMFVSRMLDIFLARFDRLVIGWFFGTRAIGLYHQARFVADAGVTASAPVTTVTFNLYARLQDDPARLGRAYALVNYFLARASLAGSTALLLAPEPVVRLLLGDEWLAAAPVLRILGLYAGLAMLLLNSQVLLFARGVIFTNVRLRLAQLAVLGPGVVAAAWLRDVEIAALAVLVSTGFAVALSWFMSRDVTRGHGARTYAAPCLALAGTVGLAQALAAWTQALPWWSLPFLPPLGFAALLVLFERGELARQLTYLRDQVRRG
jgi:O-antigen/teichoic acid export membrane protein